MAARRAVPRSLQQWATWMRAWGASPKTINTRVTGIRSLLDHSGRTDPVSFTTMDIIEWLAAQESQWTRATYATGARAWHRWLVEQGVRSDDPTEQIPAIRRPVGAARPAPTTAIDAALAVSTRRARAYIELGMYAGLRAGEIARVRGEDFNEGWLHVRGKGDRERWVPVHPALAGLRHGWPHQGWWFPARSRSGHVLPNSVSRTVSDTFKRAGHPGVTAHMLRHWFGTHVQRIAGDTRVTQELLGHASAQSTVIYTEVADSRKTETVRRLGNGDSPLRVTGGLRWG